MQKVNRLLIHDLKKAGLRATYDIPAVGVYDEFRDKYEEIMRLLNSLRPEDEVVN